jgi:uncharacterized protein Yka (UPF0111/DUF47 family)
MPGDRAEVVAVKLSRLFLPDTPDVLGMLVNQAEVTVEGMEALVRWTDGDPDASDAVRDAEHRADEFKRLLRLALRTSFLTPLDAEDLYALSERLDAALNQAKDAVREAEVMGIEPDGPEHDMAGYLAAGATRLLDAFRSLAHAESGPRSASVPREATESADAAVKAQRRLERVYRASMSALIDEEDLREVMGRRELYRRLARVGDTIVEVAERVWYAAVKEG